MTKKDYTSQKEPPTLPKAPWKQDLLWSIKGVRDYVDKNLEKLREHLAAAFATGMGFASDDGEKHVAGKKALEDSIKPLAPRHIGNFAVKFDTSKLSVIQ